jgi:hypothetical protein
MEEAEFLISVFVIGYGVSGAETPELIADISLFRSETL